MIRHADSPTPAEISGIGSDGAPVDTPHLAFLSLPFVGAQHADGRVMGVVLSIPDSVSEAGRQGIYRAVGAWERLSQDRRLTLSVDGWRRGGPFKAIVGNRRDSGTTTPSLEARGTAMDFGDADRTAEASRSTFRGHGSCTDEGVAVRRSGGGCFLRACWFAGTGEHAPVPEPLDPGCQARQGLSPLSTQRQEGGCGQTPIGACRPDLRRADPWPVDVGRRALRRLGTHAPDPGIREANGR